MKKKANFILERGIIVYRIISRTVMNKTIKKTADSARSGKKRHLLLKERQTNSYSLVISNYIRCTVSVDNVGPFHLK